MATKIRLTRGGTKKKPFYRIIVCDSRSPREGRFIEVLGHYNPRTSPPTIHLDREKFSQWCKVGAQATLTVKKIARQHKKASVSQ